MNNIEILEEFIKYFEAEATQRKYRRNISITVGEDDIEAIKNLIQENKELKETLRSEIQAFNKMKELAETIRKENVEYIIQNRQYELHYIPKTKVKELENCLQMAKQIMTADISEDFDCMKLKEFKEYLLNEIKLNENFEE